MGCTQKRKNGMDGFSYVILVHEYVCATAFAH